MYRNLLPKLTPAALTLILIAAMTLLPFLGLTDFNTKGEPREAVVAQTMLQTDNWILPGNNGGEFAYKPPLFHWAVAVSSLPAGEVTEYSSRLPSALAAIIMALATYTFFSRRRDEPTGFITSLIMLTTFEVHRAATNCRVDMLLTMFIVLALYTLLRWSERNLQGFPFAAALLMGCGTLVKGPVAILLPCMVAGIHYLLRSDGKPSQRLWTAFSRFVLVAAAALTLPAIWYYAAYQQGGDKFLYLVYEENVLRFLGKMPYPSHQHGPLYYIPMLLAGMLPWTLLIAESLLHRRKFRIVTAKPKPHLPVRIINWWKQKDTTEQFCLLATVTILLFYTIPSSKRGVYILPVYPFLSYYLARYILWLKDIKPRALKTYEWTVSALIIIGIAAYVAIQSGLVTAETFGEHFSEKNGALLEALRTASVGEWTYPVVAAALIGVFYALRRLPRTVSPSLYNVIAALLLLDTFILPPMMSSRSDKPMAQRVETLARQRPLYAYIDDDSGMMHYFTLNFYAHNTIRNFPTETESERFNKTSSPLPSEAYLLTGSATMQIFRERYPQYTCTLVEDFHRRSCDIKQDVQVWLVKQTHP